MPRTSVVLVLCLVLSSVSDAQDLTQDSPDKKAVKELVNQLGDASFAKRDAARRQLAALGLAAKEALMEGMKHSDLEVRLRAHEILSRAMKLEFERRIDLFVKGEFEPEGDAFPSWSRVKRLLGDVRSTRELYAAMLRREATLLEALEDDDDVAAVYMDRLQELQRQAYGQAAVDEPIESVSAAALLLVAAETKAANPSVHSRLYSLLVHSKLKDVVNVSEHKLAIQRLLDAWVRRQGVSDGNYYGLLIALHYDASESCLKIARQILDDKSSSHRIVQYAAIAVARFGAAEEDEARLRKHLANKTVCHTWSNSRLKKKGVIKIEIRDVVLVCLLHLRNEDPKSYGFKLLQANPATLYHIYTFGFIEDDERKSAFQKWEKAAG